MSAGEVDYIIVGAGSAGSALAYRLSESGRYTVLVLEAGGSDLHPWVQMPIGYGKAYYDARLNWKYTSEPVEGLGGRTSYWPRGKVMGGSSSINAMVYVRGHPRDFDDWAAAGAAGWDWAGVAPYFQRMERWSRGGDAHRGGSGPLPVQDVSAALHPLSHRWLDAARESQLPLTDDYNGADMEGAFHYQLTTKGGIRASTSRAYLRPALRRGGVRLETRAHVLRLEFDGRRVTGVTYRCRGQDKTVSAGREVILSAGAVNTPQIMMLSGLGPEPTLKSVGVTPVANLPAVGQHLQDHIGVDLYYRSRVPTLNQQLGPWWGKLWQGLRYVLTRTGPLSLSINQGGGFVRINPAADVPDMQLYFSPVSYTRAPAGKRPMMSPDPFPGFLMGASACRPESRGDITLRSADPFEAPVIRPDYFSAPADLPALVGAITYLRRIAAAPALASVIKEEYLPGPEATDETTLGDYVRDTAWTVFHPCATCRMGSDAKGSVVDPRLRVHGVTGLRIADASVFPNVTSGNINAPSVMVGEKASDLILEDAA